MNNDNKDTYEKLMGYGQGDLFSEKGFDEMQKIKNYEIGFKLFRAFFWVIYLVSMAIILTASALESLTFILIGLGTMLLCTVFYIIYASKTAAAGVMNPKYANGMSKKSVLFSGIFLLIVWAVMFAGGGQKIEVAGMWINLGVMYIGTYLCARKNMKVLEKMLNDNDGEE